jgi:hypothetical protein
MNYPSIRIEGAILSPDILDRLEDLQGQRPSDFGIPSPAKVKDEIARAWADAQDYWRIYQRKMESLRPDSLATTETRNLWIVPLLGLLGYQIEYQHQAIKIGEKSFPLSHRMINRALAAVHITGYRDPAGLDRKPERAAGPRMSAHAMVQEYLNLSDQLYAIVTNGKLLRLLRDSSRLVKLTYLEFDLDRIFTDGLFADFAVIYRLLHATRLPIFPDAAAESLIERYHQDSVESGARIRDGLSRAVEQAIRAFANGLLAHPANQALRNSVQDGSLKPDAFYHHLLRLIYRLLFLLVIEERHLVYPLSPSAIKRDLYYRYYSLQRLRHLAEKRYLADPRHDDLWLALLACFRLFEDGGPGPKLGIAPLAGDLFSPDAIGPIGGCLLDNRTVLECLRSLSLYLNPDTNQLIRVSYAALNVEELGSIYEGLLKFEASFASDESRFSFLLRPSGDDTQSHYTPEDLVQPLLKHSLDYLIADKLKESDKAKALLSLRVADIACGSGHILLAAARRIATELAIVRTGEEQPSPSAFRSAVRDVIRVCIYGVDLNPLAVELCKVALWLEAHSPGEPLNFLDHHIKCGNSIVGFVNREDVSEGVADEAFAVMPGDDRDVASTLRKRNKDERRQQRQMSLNLSPIIRARLDAIVDRWKALSRLPERTPAEIETKKAEFSAFASGKDAWLLNQIAAIPIAQFYLPKTHENAAEAITDEQFRRYWKGEQTPQGRGPAMAWTLANRKRFFHWFLEFPDVMARGGFDCILGNPPYLGAQKVSQLYGRRFFEYLSYAFKAGGLADLVAYFVRRIFTLVREDGFLALLATSALCKGDSRVTGLAPITACGGVINYVVRKMKWPGQAATHVALFAIKKGQFDGSPFLDGRPTDVISSYFDDDPIGEATLAQLHENSDQSFIGSNFNGDGFVVDQSFVNSCMSIDRRYGDVLFRNLLGANVNTDPEVAHSRWIICFFDWNQEQAKQYPLCFSRVEELVKPHRQHNSSKVLRERWWQYERLRKPLYNSIRGAERVLVRSQAGKHNVFEFVSNHFIFDQKVVVFALRSFADYGFLNSSIHEVFVWRFSGDLGGTTINYSPERVFETYPRPPGNAVVEGLGGRYHTLRRSLMHSLSVGLTDLYNLFHTRDLSPAKVAKVSRTSESDANAGFQGILQLRALHRELDEAVLAAYGWSVAISLGHDFHEIETLPENDRVRYTVSPAARKEILKRLLALNHERAEAEANAVTTVAKPKRARKTALAATEIADIDLFVAMSYPATETDKAICAAAVAAVEQSNGLNSTDHLDVLHLATHPAWCKAFLTAADQKQVDTAVAKAPRTLFVGENDSIRWKDARDHLEQRKALKVDHSATAQPIIAGADLAAVKATLPAGVDEVVTLALKALDRVCSIRQQSVAATQEQLSRGASKPATDGRVKTSH